MQAPDVLAPYEPYPWQIKAWRDKSRLLVASGSAGGGKSRFAGEKVHGYMLKYPGSTGLVLRKTRQSTVNSTILFMERKIIGNDPKVTHVQSKARFEYSNESILCYGGMADEEQREQIRSIGQDGALDIVWMEEANKFKREDFNEVLPRMRGKAASWRQILLTTNPDGPKHWIKKDLMDTKLAALYFSSAADNPANPSDYIETLNLLTGVQKKRLVDGKWVQAEGVIYDNWSTDNIDGDKAKYDPTLPIIWAIDDGYKNPRVILICQEHSDGTIVVLAEYYRSQQLFEQSLADVRGMGFPDPNFAVHDPSAAEFAAFLWSQGIQTIAADNTVSEGIKSVRSYIRDGNDVISLFVNPLCDTLIEEMGSYAYDDSVTLQGGDPKPLKEADHSCDALRYLIHTPHAYRVPRGGLN